MMPADARPACAGNLRLVDAAFERGKAANVAARELATLCRTCPLAESCQRHLIERREHGVWGATRRSVQGSGYAFGPPLGRLKVVA